MISCLKIIPYPCSNSFFPSLTCKKVLVGGCFDLLHYGHFSFFKAAKERGDFLIVALESDATIIRLKRNFPIHKQKQRAEILCDFMCIDLILLLPELKTFQDYLTLVKTIHPQFLAVTKGDPQIENKKKQAQEVNASVIEVNQLIDGLSSSLIRHSHL